MRIAQIRRLDVTNGEGIGIALFTAGCPIRCKNCFNSELWSMDAGKEWSEEYKQQILKLLEPEHVRRISILGGEPLIERNIEPLTELFKDIRKLYGNSKRIWVWTGQLYENVSQKYNELISLIDILVDGPYVDELKDAKLLWKGSSNQRVIDVQCTLKNGSIALYDSDFL